MKLFLKTTLRKRRNDEDDNEGPFALKQKPDEEHFNGLKKNMSIKERVANFLEMLTKAN